MDPMKAPPTATGDTSKPLGISAWTILDTVGAAVIAVALLGEVGAVLAGIAARAFFGTPILWTEEIARLSLSTLAFVGGALAYRHDHHASVMIVLNRLPPPLRKVCLAVADILVLGLSIVLLYLSVHLAASEWSRETPVLQVSYSIFMLPLVVSTPLFGVYAINRLLRSEPAHILRAGGIVIAGAIVLAAVHQGWLPGVGSEAAIYLCLVSLFGLVFIGLPIGFALLVSSTGYFWLTDAVPLIAAPQRMVGDTGNFILLSIPFFIFAGLIMERGELSLRLVEFGRTLVGHIRGGLHQVAVVSMYLVSGLSGSDAADVAAVGTVMRNMPESREYPREESAAVLAASAVMGSTVPPSIAMLLLGSITQITIAGLFVGGLLPAVAMAVCLMILIAFKARRRTAVTVARAPLRAVARSGVAAIIPFLMPAILFGGILTGLATPTEVSSVAVLYGLIVAMFVYRVLDLRGLMRAAIDSALLTGMILFILAAASTFSWALTIGLLPEKLVALLQSFGGESSTVFILCSILLLIVTGSLLEGLPALNVLAPMLVPMAAEFDVNQLHYGMVLLIAMGVGVFAPPTGVGFYIACGVMRVPVEAAAKAALPYFAALILGLLIVAFVPWITLSLPHLFGIYG